MHLPRLRTLEFQWLQYGDIQCLPIQAPELVCLRCEGDKFSKLLDIMQWSRQLEALIEVTTENSNDATSKHIDRFCQLLSATHWPKLQEIDLNVAISKQCVRALVNAKMLRRVQIRPEGGGIQPEDVRFLLEQLPNLEDLMIRHHERIEAHHGPAPAPEVKGQAEGQPQQLQTGIDLSSGDQSTLSTVSTVTETKATASTSAQTAVTVLKIKSLWLDVADNALFSGMAAPALQILNLNGPDCKVTNMATFLQSVNADTVLDLSLSRIPNASQVLASASSTTLTSNSSNSNADASTKASKPFPVLPLLKLTVTSDTLTLAQLPDMLMGVGRFCQVLELFLGDGIGREEQAVLPDILTAYPLPKLRELMVTVGG